MIGRKRKEGRVVRNEREGMREVFEGFYSPVYPKLESNVFLFFEGFLKNVQIIVYLEGFLIYWRLGY